MGAVEDDYEFVVSFYRGSLVGLCGGRRGAVGEGEWESIRKASIVSVMESNWRASEDSLSRVPFMRGLCWTPLRMGDAAGGILSKDVIFTRPLCVCVCVWQSATGRFLSG